MAGLYKIFGENDYLTCPEEHSNCHVVIDGSNLQYLFTEKNHALSNLPAYEQSVRNFFQHFLAAQITPHVFFDGPSKSDPSKWQRGRKRREERLMKLSRQTSGLKYFDFPKPTAIQDIFRDVIESLGIRSIQVSAKRDYTLEMVSHAKHLNAFLVSASTKFFLEDIPRGFVCPPENAFKEFGPKSKCVFETFQFRKFSKLINLGESPNPYALTMWSVVLFNRDTFELFTKPFFEKTSHRPKYYPKGQTLWMSSILSDKCRKVSQLKLLQFFLENTRAEAERIIYEQLYPGDRKEAKLLFGQNIAASLIEPNDVFERLEKQIEAGEFCDEDVPLWFLRYLTTECKIIPGLMDTLTDKRHHLMSLLEDFEKDSVNKTTLRLRRIAYGILFSEAEDCDKSIKVTELDRVRLKLEETEETPIWGLMDPRNPSDIFQVPGLKQMEFLPKSERRELFLLSMGITEHLCRAIKSEKSLYVTVILRYWLAANKDIRRRDLLEVLLTVLAVEQEYSKPSHIFWKPVRLSKSARMELGIQFNIQSVSTVQKNFACMHPLALLQNATLFGRTLHRLFMQPLGAHSDAIETITSEVAFYHVHKLSEREGAAFEDLILSYLDEESGRNFREVVDLILNEEDLCIGRDILRGFRGDDQRP